MQIYGLTDNTGAVRYIGKARDAKKRFKQHMSCKRNGRVYVWLRSLDYVPGLIVIAECSETEWIEAERKAIADARAAGADLLNVADGGDQPYCSPQVRAQNGRRNAAKRDKRLWALKRSLGQAFKRGHVSEATKAKMRLRMDVFGQFAPYL